MGKLVRAIAPPERMVHVKHSRETLIFLPMPHCVAKT